MAEPSDPGVEEVIEVSEAKIIENLRVENESLRHENLKMRIALEQMLSETKALRLQFDGLAESIQKDQKVKPTKKKGKR